MAIKKVVCQDDSIKQVCEKFQLSRRSCFVWFDKKFWDCFSRFFIIHDMKLNPNIRNTIRSLFLTVIKISMGICCVSWFLVLAIKLTYLIANTKNQETQQIPIDILMIVNHMPGFAELHVLNRIFETHRQHYSRLLSVFS